MWAARIDTKASALIRAFGADAYSKARQRERQADNNATAQRWRRVALAVARKTGKRVDLDDLDSNGFGQSLRRRHASSTSFNRAGPTWGTEAHDFRQVRCARPNV